VTLTFAIALVFPLAFRALPQAPASSSPSTTPSQPSTSSTPPASKPDAKRAKEAYKQGLRAERAKKWQAAYDAYSDAVHWAPENHDYFLHREVAKSRVVQEKVDLAERDAVSGRLSDARSKLIEARNLDPSNSIVKERLNELSGVDADRTRSVVKEIELGGEVHLEHQPGTRNFDYRGNTQSLYESIARQFGVDVAFDADLSPRTVRFKIDNVDFQTAMRLAGDLTGTFWRPLTRHLFFVADSTTQKRRDYDVSLVRTVLLPESATNDQMTEILRTVRDVTNITRTDLDMRARTLTLRASPRAIAIATDLIDDLEKPAGELVLEIEVLQVNRDYARQLGITPPQTGQVYSINSQEVQEAEQSAAGLASVLEQIFGTPSSLSGLTPSQIASSQSGISSLLPPLVAFGGGKTMFLATLPSAAVNFAEMLSLVRQGQRLLLRAEDGKPASFFVGERYPVTLAQYSSSLGTSLSSVLTSSDLQESELTTGNLPTFVTTADLRNNGVQDLIVSNSKDNTVSVFLGNGDGTFADQVTYPTGNGPTWIATGDLNKDKNLDLIVADTSDNKISILLGNGDGTFQPRVDLPTGATPVSVVAANLHDKSATGNLDLVVANQSDSNLSIFPGNGDGTFGTPSLLVTGIAPTAIAAADLNNDGHIDLVVANKNDQPSPSISVFLGNGDGTFQPVTKYLTGNSPVWVSTGDFNGDGVLDLAVANNADDTVSILLGQTDAKGNPTGLFGAKTDYSAGGGPTSIAVADYNLDGILDLAVTDKSDNAISLLLGESGGVFAQNYELAVGTNPLSIVTADFNGDSRPDAAVANDGSNTVTVILNEQSTSSSTSSFSNEFPNSEYIDIGLKVKATPRIHQDDEVTLQLNFELSSLAGSSVNSIPIISNNTVEQTVRLKLNETSAVAGILQSQLSGNINGTPGIANIPILGPLEGNQNNQRQESELLVLVTPRMVTLTPRKDHVIYAGQGAPEAPGSLGPRLEGRGEPFRPQPQPQPENPPSQPVQSQNPPQQPPQVPPQPEPEPQQ
jgi:hypothetical protein